MAFQDFFDSYVETALWSSTDNADDTGGEPLDANYSVEDIDAASLEAMRGECRDFYQANADTWQEASEGDVSDSYAGHNFWLTRNRHGAGFWDGRYREDIGRKLTDAAHAYGECDLYIGDDERIYAT